MIKIILEGNPITKKNSSRIVTLKGGRTFLLPSKAYTDYEKRCLHLTPKLHLNSRVNLKCVYYMQTRRKVDLVNLIEATCDILVKGGTLEDDNCSIVVSHDGSVVLYDKENPRVEIYIEEI